MSLRRFVILFALATCALGFSSLVPGAAAHRSSCHAAETCPSDAHTYVWFDGGGIGWNCAVESPSADWVSGQTTILYQFVHEPVYVGGYVCSFAAAGLAPPEDPLRLRPGPWTRYIAVSSARKMLSKIDRHALPTYGLPALYLPGWLPASYTLTGWTRAIDATETQMPDVSLYLGLKHPSHVRDGRPSWSVVPLTPELGGCAGNFSYIPHQTRVPGRTIRYGNVAFSGGVFMGEVVVCFANGVAARFRIDIPLPLASLKKIGVQTVRATY
jgi:hypothetical protein